MRCRSELLLYLPPWPGGREKDLRFKLNVSVFHAGVEAGDRVAGIFHAQAVAQAEALFFSGLATHSAPSCSAIIPRDSTLALKNGSMLLMANTLSSW